MDDPSSEAGQTEKPEPGVDGGRGEEAAEDEVTE